MSKDSSSSSYDQSSDVSDAHLRLSLTIVGSSISVVLSSVMFYAYYIFRRRLRNSLNDSYVLGLGGTQICQSAQKLICAAVFMQQLPQVDGAWCSVNAVLVQALDVASQVFLVAFLLRLLTIRGRWNCCFRTELDATVEGSGVSTMPATAESASSIPPRQQLRSGGGDSCLYALKRRHLWTRYLVPALATAAAVASSAVMYHQVVTAPDGHPYINERPRLPENGMFAIGFGWCWIPSHGFEMLRIFCKYVVTAGVVIVVLGLSVRFVADECRASLRLHTSIHIRLGALLLYMVVAYLLGGAAEGKFVPYLSQENQQPSNYETVRQVATCFFAAYGAFVSLLFLWTERLWHPLLHCNDELSSEGFSTAVCHLLTLEVRGAVMLSALNVSASDRFFASDERSDFGAYGDGYGSVTRAFLSPARDVLTSAASVVRSPAPSSSQSGADAHV